MSLRLVPMKGKCKTKCTQETMFRELINLYYKLLDCLISIELVVVRLEFLPHA